MVENGPFGGPVWAPRAATGSFWGTRLQHIIMSAKIESGRFGIHGAQHGSAADTFHKQAAATLTMAAGFFSLGWGLSNTRFFCLTLSQKRW